MAVNVSYADFTIITLVIIFGFEGYRAGFFKGVLSSNGLIFALVISVVTVPYSARFYNFVIELSPNISILMGFTTIYVLLLLLYALFLQWVHTLMKMEVVDWFNRVAGTLIGLYKGLLSVSLLSIGFSLLPAPDAVKSIEAQSTFMQPVKYFAPKNYNLFRKLNPYIPSFEQTLKNTFAQMEKEPDEMAATLINDFGSQALENTVTKKR
jgi:uncharacterized membrane protein required for colicin V production